MDSIFFVGLDLGQAQDFSALAVVERRVLRTGELDEAGQEIRPVRFDVRHLHRPPLNTPYPAIVETVRTLMAWPPLAERCHLIADATGVGAPVVDLLKRAGLDPVAVTITGGDSVNGGGRAWRVPKRDLVSNLAVLFQSERLKVAEGLPHAADLVRELLNFRAKISVAGHDSYEAWREGIHDDLVLAVALAVWWANMRKPFRRAITPRHGPPIYRDEQW
jgi:hypothetical protein